MQYAILHKNLNKLQPQKNKKVEIVDSRKKPQLDEKLYTVVRFRAKGVESTRIYRHNRPEQPPILKTSTWIETPNKYGLPSFTRLLRPVDKYGR